MDPRLPAIEILGVPVARLDHDAALREINKLYDGAGPARVVYVNAHSLNLAASDPEYAGILRRADLVLNDGVGMALAARIRGASFPENLNGSDFNPLIVGLASERGWPVFFLGAAEGVADGTAERLGHRYPALRVAGTLHGYAGTAASVEAVRASGAHLLMVAMGNPLQERFLDRHLAGTGARIGVGVGAFFDFTAGVVPRAPAWMNEAGVEWMWRLAQEPRRMWRRYVVGNPLFLARVVRERLSGSTVR